jgi:predicted metal-dependent hydrolase
MMTSGSWRGEGSATRIRDEVRLFVDAFNRGEFFLAHEILEEPWRTPGDPFHRDDGVRGLILLAALYVHRTRGNDRGVRDLAAKAWPRLAPRAPFVHGVDIRPALAVLARHAHDAELPFVRLSLGGQDD